MFSFLGRNKQPEALLPVIAIVSYRGEFNGNVEEDRKELHNELMQQLNGVVDAVVVLPPNVNCKISCIE